MKYNEILQHYGAQKQVLQCKKTAKSTETRQVRVFHKNLFFANFEWYLGGLGVSGAWHGPYEAIPSNFGGMGEVDFHVFLEILETHFITKYLQIGPRASRLVLGFF